GKVGVGVSERFLVRTGDVGGNVLLQVPTLVLVERREERDDLAVDVFGRAVGVCLASPRHDDGSYQARGDVSVFAGVRGIHPHGRTGIVLRPGQLRNVPLVRERRPGRHRVFRSLVSNVAGSIGNISGATRVSQTEDVGRTNAVGPRGVVLEDDF